MTEPSEIKEVLKPCPFCGGKFNVNAWNHRALKNEEASTIVPLVEQAPAKLETSYFTFGVSMKPVYRGERIPSSSVIKITAENPREVMFSYFGDKWAFEYENFGKLSKYNTSGDIIEIFVVNDNVL